MRGKVCEARYARLAMYEVFVVFVEYGRYAGYWVSVVYCGEVQNRKLLK